MGYERFDCIPIGSIGIDIDSGELEVVFVWTGVVYFIDNKLQR